jgi:branched-chain amino acid transport system ATP-binding protein
VETQLSVRDLTLAFGAVRALDNVSLEIRRGSIHAIIGPNGAGKTSLLNCISRVYQPASGAITFDGRNILRLHRHALVSAGIARTFQSIALFKAMSVLDNVLIGHHSRMGLRLLPGVAAPPARWTLDVCGALIEPLASAVYLGPVARRERRNREEVEEVLAFLELDSVRDRVVGELPYGVQKRVDLARALAARPSLLLLDEPMAGMTTYEKEVMVRFIRETNRDRGVTVVLIEHDMSVVMGLSEEITVLDFGRKLMTGTPAEVRVNPRVIEAYLGEDVGTVKDEAPVGDFLQPVPGAGPRQV